MGKMSSAIWQEFLANFEDAKKELGEPEVLWYRGHSDDAFYLLPSLLRNKNGLSKEKDLFFKFKRYAERLFSKRESEWETLFDMQHYGVPTRLLDWTENFGIALFFAAYYNDRFSKGKNAAVYLLDPIALNKSTVGTKILRIPDEEKDFSYTQIYFEKKPFLANAPIAIEPILINNRMTAQRGTFTVHHDSISPIEKDFPNAIKKIVLPAAAIPDAKEFLNLANINEYTVFPDMGGIAGYLKQTLGLY